MTNFICTSNNTTHITVFSPFKDLLALTVTASFFGTVIHTLFCFLVFPVAPAHKLRSKQIQVRLPRTIRSIFFLVIPSSLAKSLEAFNDASCNKQILFHRIFHALSPRSSCVLRANLNGRKYLKLLSNQIPFIELSWNNSWQIGVIKTYRYNFFIDTSLIMCCSHYDNDCERW